MTDTSQKIDTEEGFTHAVNLGYRLWQAQHAVERVMDEALNHLGIRVTQAAALAFLHRQPGLSGAELARRLLLTPQSVASLLASFEARGLVVRTLHPVHRGFRETVLTDTGKEIMEESVKIVERVNLAISRDMKTSELDQLHRLLGLCLKNVQSLEAGARQ